MTISSSKMNSKHNSSSLLKCIKHACILWSNWITCGIFSIHGPSSRIILLPTTSRHLTFCNGWRLLNHGVISSLKSMSASCKITIHVRSYRIKSTRVWKRMLKLNSRNRHRGKSWTINETRGTKSSSMSCMARRRIFSGSSMLFRTWSKQQS